MKNLECDFCGEPGTEYRIRDDGYYFCLCKECIRRDSLNHHPSEVVGKPISREEYIYYLMGEIAADSVPFKTFMESFEIDEVRSVIGKFLDEMGVEEIMKS